MAVHKDYNMCVLNAPDCLVPPLMVKLHIQTYSFAHIEVVSAAHQVLQPTVTTREMLDSIFSHNM